MINGTVYGIALNDKDELVKLAGEFNEKPYLAPPKAPILYIKPRNCFSFYGAAVAMPVGEKALVAAPCIAVMFARDVTKETAQGALSAIGAACLAIDVSIPNPSYYRPAIKQKCRDGFLPLGAWGKWDDSFEKNEISTKINGKNAHNWDLRRLNRSAADAISQLSQFMTLKANDVLLLGLPHDAPLVEIGDEIEIRMNGLSSLKTNFIAENV